jgi:replicative DNA helicase
MSQNEFVPNKKKKKEPLDPSEKMENLQRRIQPQNIEAEEAVLGAILIYNEALHQVLSIVQPGDFYLEKHKSIYEAMLELERDGKPIDQIAVANQMAITDEKKLEQAGGLAYISSLSDRIPTAANVAYYAQIVREKSIVRQLITVGTEIVAEAYDDVEDVFMFLDQAERRIFEIREDRSSKELTHAKDIVRETFKLIESLFDKKELVTGVPTGFDDFDKMTSGLQPSDLIILAARPSMGKAQPLDAPIKTVDGWKPMGELQLGDRLASVDQRPSQVVGIFPQGEKEIYRVTFSDGRSTECCDEHLWRVHHHRWEAPRVLPTAQIQTMLTRDCYQEGLWIDTTQGHFGHELPLPVEPWALGRFLAEEYPTPEALSGSRRASEPLACVSALQASIEALGACGASPEKKSIPALYLEANREARIALLQGILDGDGRRTSSGALRFSTTSERFARDVTSLVRSLGGICSIQPKASTWPGQDGTERVAYVLDIADCDVVSLGSEDGYAGRALSNRQPRLTFHSIEKVRVAPAQCIQVSHPLHLYLTDDYVTTHNTALALNIATNAAVFHNRPVAVFSLEMSKEQLMNRMLCLLGRVSGQRMRTGQMKDDDIPRLFETAERLSKSPVYIDDSGDLSPLELRAKCRRLKMELGELGMIIIDYLQLMRGDTPGASREREIAEISRGLKVLAKELHCPVVALSQLNRTLERRPDKRPIMSDLRESGSIEQDADVIMFVYRDEVYHEDTEEKGVAEIIIGKQRNGPIGTVRLRFFHEYTRFDNLYPGDL